MQTLDAQITEIPGFGGTSIWRGSRGRFVKPDHVVRAATPSTRRKLKRHRDPNLAVDLQNESFKDRFASYVSPPDPNGCQRWKGTFDRRGYGVLRAAGKMRKAHRASWALHHPGAEMPQVVMHSCDNRWCVAPDHLIGGTQADNLRDAAAKGRMFTPRGQKLISDADVVEMRRMRRDGATLAELSERFGCSWAHVSNICAGRKRARVVEVVMPDGQVQAAKGM
jgi:hypothetical protein